MFNPYSARPIGTEKFEQHLEDCQTEAYYDRVLPFEESEVKLYSGRAPWKTEAATDGWTKLAMAVVYGAFLEYLKEYRASHEALARGNNGDWVLHNSWCLRMENEYFRTNPTLEHMFDTVLKKVCWEGPEQIDKAIRMLQRELGWVATDGRCRRKAAS